MKQLIFSCAGSLFTDPSSILKRNVDVKQILKHLMKFCFGDDCLLMAFANKVKLRDLLIFRRRGRQVFLFTHHGLAESSKVLSVLTNLCVDRMIRVTQFLLAYLAHLWSLLEEHPG